MQRRPVAGPADAAFNRCAHTPLRCQLPLILPLFSITRLSINRSPLPRAVIDTKSSIVHSQRSPVTRATVTL